MDKRRSGKAECLLVSVTRRVSELGCHALAKDALQDESGSSSVNGHSRFAFSVLLVTHEDEVFVFGGFSVVGQIECQYDVGLDATSAISQNRGTNELMDFDNEKKRCVCC